MPDKQFHDAQIGELVQQKLEGLRDEVLKMAQENNIENTEELIAEIDAFRKKFYKNPRRPKNKGGTLDVDDQ